MCSAVAWMWSASSLVRWTAAAAIFWGEAPAWRARWRLRRRRDRIRALGLAVLCGEPNVDVLAGNMPRPPRHVQHDGLGPRGLLDEAADGCDLPPSRYSSHTWWRQEWQDRSPSRVLTGERG